MANWPANAKLARQARKQMVNMHYVQPLPITDANNKPIHPADYDVAMRGSIALIQITLRRQAPGSRERIWAILELARIIAVAKPYCRTLTFHKNIVKVEKEEEDT
jgi:hypothetical protein